MAEMQETKMKIKVDLACEKCRKKIKKVLCAIPQIQNQEYNNKDNVVLITVVSCNPEKVKKKIYCKGGKTVKDIEIIKPKPPPPPPPPPCCKKCCEGHCGGSCRAGCKKCCEGHCGGSCSGCTKCCEGHCGGSCSGCKKCCEGHCGGSCSGCTKCCEGHCGGSCSGCHKPPPPPPPCCKKCCEGHCGGSCSGCHRLDGPCYGPCYNKPFCPSSCTYYICDACTIM